MPRTALVPLADGFEEIEAVTIVDVLRRAGVVVTVAALRGHPVRGAHGIALAADVTLEEVRTRRYDAVVLPGGMPGAVNLRDDPRVREALENCVRRAGTAAAICAAPIVLDAAG